MSNGIIDQPFETFLVFANMTMRECDVEELSEVGINLCVHDFMLCLVR
jgi:hypothetical protein